MTTEAEAKKKWCPFARAPNAHAVDNPIPVNRSGNAPDPDCFCIASACMAWRWSEIRDDPNGEPPSTWPDIADYHLHDSRRRFIRFGYCGAAGVVRP